MFWVLDLDGVSEKNEMSELSKIHKTTEFRL